MAMVAEEAEVKTAAGGAVAVGATTVGTMETAGATKEIEAAATKMPAAALAEAAMEVVTMEEAEMETMAMAVAAVEMAVATMETGEAAM